MASRSTPPSKRELREDDDNESRRRKKLEKGKEPAAKDADEEPLFDDNKFAAELLRSAFKKLQGVGEAFDIKAHHDVYKDPILKGLAFRIHGLAEKLENLL
jgi:ribosomal protein S8E